MTDTDPRRLVTEAEQVLTYSAGMPDADRDIRAAILALLAAEPAADRDPDTDMPWTPEISPWGGDQR